MAIITGTFSGTGNSNGIVSGKVYVDLTFSGTATVNCQWQLDGTNWRTISTHTGSTQLVVDTGGIPFRLNCSAYTDAVTYAMRDK